MTLSFVAHVQIRDRNLWGSVKTLDPLSRTASVDSDDKQKGKQRKKSAGNFADGDLLTRFTLGLPCSELMQARLVTTMVLNNATCYKLCALQSQRLSLTDCFCAPLQDLESRLGV